MKIKRNKLKKKRLYDVNTEGISHPTDMRMIEGLEHSCSRETQHKNEAALTQDETTKFRTVSRNLLNSSCCVRSNHGAQFTASVVRWARRGAAICSATDSRGRSRVALSPAPAVRHTRCDCDSATCVASAPATLRHLPKPILAWSSPG